ncbi:MAG: hemolysin family protein [Anaerovorax sp.]
MDNPGSGLIIALVLLILASAYFSASETAFSSLNKIRLKNLALKGSKRALLALSLSEDYDKLLSTILIGNNIVNIVAASLATVLFVGYFGEAGVAISTVVVTILVLIFGEISPKSLAKEFPEKFSMFSAPFLKVLSFLLGPVNYLFKLWKGCLSKLFKISKEDVITEEELLTIVDEAQEGGTLEIHEHELIKSAIEFDNLDASYVLTPRVELVSAEINQSLEEIAALFLESGYSRLPIYEGNIDHILGILHEKDFYPLVMHGSQSVADVLRPALRITITLKLSKLLRRLQQSKSHIAIVTDEYGGTEGIVTLEDIIEELVGDIWDEHDDIVAAAAKDLAKISDNQYEVAGSLNLNKFFETFHIYEEDLESTTVGGWVLEKLGLIPHVGDHFTYNNLFITISQLDGNRITKILISLLPSSEESQESQSE